MEKTLFNMKMTAKMLERESKKQEKKQHECDAKAKQAMAKGDEERVKIFAGEALRCKNTSIQYVRLGARIDAVSARVEAAIRMKTFSKQMGHVVGDMESVLDSMDPVKINNMMDKFEKQFENLDVGTATMDESISRATATSMPEDQVSQYVEMLKAQDQLARADELRRTGVGHGVAAPSTAAAGSDKVATAAGGPPAPSNNNQQGGPGQNQGGSGGAGASGGGGGGGGMDVADALAARLASLRK